MPRAFPFDLGVALARKKLQARGRAAPDLVGMARLAFRPLTLALWPDLLRLFGDRGACGGCWCMAWRLTRGEWERGKGGVNRSAFRALARARRPLGILAYAGAEPVGWCAVAPRGEFPALERSRILRPVDPQPVWSITCLFVARPQRRLGLSVRLLRAATAFARSRGARIVEGYPVEPVQALPDAFAWTGLASAFSRAGFREVARRSPQRPIMRRVFSSRARTPRRRQSRS